MGVTSLDPRLSHGVRRTTPRCGGYNERQRTFALTRLVLAIPTTDIGLAERCLSSFRKSRAFHDWLVLIQYNGRDAGVSSHSSEPNVLLIGYDDSQSLAEAFARAGGCRPELLFGAQTFNRSYGGASNLVMATAYALGARWIGKVDDDCLCNTRNAESWLTRAQAHALRGDSCCYYGPYSGSPSGCVHVLSETTGNELVRLVYPKEEHGDRLSVATPHTKPALKNGNLLVPVSFARRECYPVLFDVTTGIHARGEVYWWAHALESAGQHMEYRSDLVLEHRPLREVNVQSWLDAIVLGYDLSRIDLAIARTGAVPSRSERQRMLDEFRDWLARAEFPLSIHAERLLALIDPASAFEFADRIVAENPIRRAAWRALMESDSHSLVARTLPHALIPEGFAWD